MHAISTDNMHTWVKQYDWTFGSSAGYEPYDWRDPFVFYDNEMDVWRMLLAARKKTGPDRRRGVTAQCISHDLINWEPLNHFGTPNVILQWNVQKYLNGMIGGILFIQSFQTGSLHNIGWRNL